MLIGQEAPRQEHTRRIGNGIQQLALVVLMPVSRGMESACDRGEELATIHGVASTPERQGRQYRDRQRSRRHHNLADARASTTCGDRPGAARQLACRRVGLRRAGMAGGAARIGGGENPVPTALPCLKRASSAFGLFAISLFSSATLLDISLTPHMPHPPRGRTRPARPATAVAPYATMRPQSQVRDTPVTPPSSPFSQQSWARATPAGYRAAIPTGGLLRSGL